MYFESFSLVPGLAAYRTNFQGCVYLLFVGGSKRDGPWNSHGRKLCFHGSYDLQVPIFPSFLDLIHSHLVGILMVMFYLLHTKKPESQEKQKPGNSNYFQDKDKESSMKAANIALTNTRHLHTMTKMENGAKTRSDRFFN